MYHEQDFIDAGIDHLEAFFLDGSCPSMDILMTVMDAFERVPADKAFAVHCKAGLGRTGTCIGAYLMKHYAFTAKEAIAWMRICRPGCVIGPQQQYLEKIEKLMWDQGVAEGYIEHSAGDVHPSSPKSPIVRENMKINESSNDDEDMISEEAVVGRAGQADGLLAARSRNAKNTPGRGTARSKFAPAASTDLPSAPMTPMGKDKGSVPTVTPEHGTTVVAAPGSQADTALWCG